MVKLNPPSPKTHQVCYFLPIGVILVHLFYGKFDQRFYPAKHTSSRLFLLKHDDSTRLKSSKQAKMSIARYGDLKKSENSL
jgi:hypothetical protein